MKQIIFFIAILLVTVSVAAQNLNRKFIDASFQDDDVLSVVVSDGEYHIQFYNKAIVETSFYPNKEQSITNSHAVILEPQNSNAKYTADDVNVYFQNDNLKVVIQKKPFHISYYYKDKFMTSEKRGYFKSEHQPLESVEGNIVADSTEKIEFNLTKDEVLYGAGARALGMNRRGYRLPLFNRAHYGYETHSELMNFTLPIVLSSKHYMIHFDNAPIGYLDLDSKEDNTLTYETISGRKTYQVIAGDSWFDIIENYTDLTGKQPLLPRWALGNFSSRFGYHSQKETLATIQKFNDDEIPVDAIILDLYWFGKDIKGTMGNLAFDKDSFPNPSQMIKDLRSKDVETILITEPFILTTSKRWNEAVEKDILAKDSLANPATYDFYFGNTGIIDVSSEKGNAWFKNIYKDLSNQGVTGFWGDLGEPEVHPNWVQHATGSAAEVHNTYGHDWAKLVYEASLEANPEQRPFVLMRAGYSGSQRYAMVPWSGDVNRTWGGLQSQPEITLQMGMQGLAYMHSDLGGFAGANLDDELYARWLQYGVFQPIYRPHAQEDVPSEPVFRSATAKSLAKEAIELRYRFLPYNYNLTFVNNQTGKPLMRPLFFEEADNTELFNYSKTYLWGKDILVSPVLEAGIKQQEVYFPKGSTWFDFYTDEIIAGGQTKTVQLYENSIPTYVRAGAFIPQAQPMQTTKAYDGNTLEIHYYHDATVSESEREFYNDDGKTVNTFDKGAYEILKFEAELEGSWLEIDLEAKHGSDFKTQEKRIQLVIHNIENPPRRYKIKGEKVNGMYNSKAKTVTLFTTWNTSKDKEIRIKLKKK